MNTLKNVSSNHLTTVGMTKVLKAIIISCFGDGHITGEQYRINQSKKIIILL